LEPGQKSLCFPTTQTLLRSAPGGGRTYQDCSGTFIVLLPALPDTAAESQAQSALFDRGCGCQRWPGQEPKRCTRSELARRDRPARTSECCSVIEHIGPLTAFQCPQQQCRRRTTHSIQSLNDEPSADLGKASNQHRAADKKNNEGIRC
jgi:hypothetical protein